MNRREFVKSATLSTMAVGLGGVALGVGKASVSAAAP